MFKSLLSKMTRNTYENTITSLKAEIYDLERQVERLQKKDKREKQVIAKIKSLPKETKEELGLYKSEN